jgi:NADPH-dependent 2,4-dienoyl-CoA reductase/sulfur reductase-like enzyme
MSSSTGASRLVIIGGSDAGISAALRAREVNPALDVTVVVADAFPNYSICGLPFYLSGEVTDWHALAHRTAADIEAQGITLLLDTVAVAIAPAARQILVRDAAGHAHSLAYGRLIIATGAEPAPPPIVGLDLPGVYPLHTMADSFRVHLHLETHTPRSAVIVGGGYIGLEMADALVHRGVAVTLVQRGPSVLGTIEAELGAHVADQLTRHGVKVVAGVAVSSIERDAAQLVVSGTMRDTAAQERDYSTAGQLVLVATGVRPVTALAASAGVELGTRGAMRVSRTMATNVPGIYAAGDCVETWHRLLERSSYLPPGTTAHKQGRVAGENAALDLSADGQSHTRRTFAGSLGTQVVKVFDLVIARTGLLEAEARMAGYDPRTVESIVWDHKVYYPGAQQMRIRLTADRPSMRLLGAQLVGNWGSEVAKRADIFATALHMGLRVDDLNDLDLSYTPPVSSPWDPVQMAALTWLRPAPPPSATSQALSLLVSTKRGDETT